MGSFAAQLYVIDRSDAVDGLALSGSGALDGLVRLSRSAPGENILNRAFLPARAPFDWLSRDAAVVDAFMNAPLCFGALKPASSESFFCAASTHCDTSSLRKIRSDLPVYLFSGSEDPVGSRLKESVRSSNATEPGAYATSPMISTLGARHETLNEINQADVRANLLSWISRVMKGRIAKGSQV